MASVLSVPVVLSVPIGEIQVQDRIRKEPGDVHDLMGSIKRHGLFSPILVEPDFKLVAGERRLEACRLLGMTHVDVRVTDRLGTAADLLQAEAEENTCRKALTPSEMVRYAKRLEEIEKPKALERKADGGRLAGRGRPVEKDTHNDSYPIEPPSGPTQGETREIVAKALGTSHSTISRARRVLEATNDPDPHVAEVAAQAAVEMERTGKVASAFFKVQEAKGPTPKRESTPSHEPLTRVYRSRGQEKAIPSAIAALRGIATALDSVGAIDADAISAEMASEWAADLDRSIKAFRTFVTKLKGHSVGTP